MVLRFFENKNFEEVGAALGASEDAAQNAREPRAGKTAEIFHETRRDASTTAIIAGAISANSVQAAPAALAKT